MNTHRRLMRGIIVLAAGVAAAFALGLVYNQPAPTSSSIRADHAVVLAQKSSDGQETHG